MFLLFVCQRLFLGGVSGDCTKTSGCTVAELKQIFHDGDAVEIVVTSLSNVESLEFLQFLNSTPANINITGAPTVLDGTKIKESESPVLSFEGQKCAVTDISFRGFASPILHSVDSQVAFKNVSFLECSVTSTSMFAFVSTEVVMEHASFNRLRADSQSFVVGYKSSFHLHRFNLMNCSLTSPSFCPLFHTLNTSVEILDSVVFGNTLDMPLIDISNSSTVAIRNVSFVDNAFSVVGVFEYNVSIGLEHISFANHSGGLLIASDNVDIEIVDAKWWGKSSKPLIDVSGSRLQMRKCRLTNSSLSGILVCSDSQANLRNINLKGIESDLPLFDSTGGRFELVRSQVINLSSKSDIPIATASSCNFTAEKSTFQALSSRVDTATSFSLVNSQILFSDLEHRETSCGLGVIDNCSVSLSNCDIVDNQCFPGSQALPFAILSLSSSQLNIIGSRFRNNRAITGTCLLVNSSAVMKEVKFKGNNAVQGAAIFGSNCTLVIQSCHFHKNMALAMGGAISVSESVVSVSTSTFERNQCDEGGGLYSLNSTLVSFHFCEVRGNEAAVGTFISVHGNSTLVTIEKSRVDLMPNRSVAVDFPENVTLKGTYFNCAVYCKLIEDLKDDTATSDSSWLPLAFVFLFLGAVALIMLSNKTLRRRWFRKILRFKTKGKYTL